MQFFGCLFMLVGIILLVLAFLLIGIVTKVLSLFGINLPWEKWLNGRWYTYTNAPHAGNQQEGSQTYSQPDTSAKVEKKKIFTEDDGEYVEFEEIKD